MLPSHARAATPGGICVSGKVAKEVEKKLAFVFEPMGEQKVKNIGEPVQAYRVVLDPTAKGKPIRVYRYLRTWRVSVAAAGLVVLALGVATALWRPWERAIEPTASLTNAEADT